MFDGLLNSFACAFTQSNRLLTLQFGGDGFEPEALLPHILRGTHSISSLYRYELDCLSANAFIELKDLLGLPVQVGILDPVGDERIITGVVTSVATLGADGGFSAYRLVIEPALALLAKRRTSRVFQDQSVPEIVKTLLDEHLAAYPLFASAFKLDPQLTETYPARSYCLQYRESDLVFMTRLLREEGIAWRFVFTAGEMPVHTLVLFDDPYNLEQSLLGRVRFHRADGTESEDGLQSWASSRQIVSSQVSLSSYDYKSVTPNQAQDRSQIDQGQAGDQAQSNLEDYDPQSLYYGDPDDLSRYTTLRQKALDRSAKTFTATGTVRALNVGEWFELTDHPVHDQDMPEQRQFVVTGETLTAQNNLPGDVQNGLAGLLAIVTAASATGKGATSAATSNTTGNNPPPFQSQLTLTRRGIDLTPDYAHSTHAKPTSLGVQTATVVGPAGEELHTDKLGRIKIQFHWQRPSEHPEFGANLDDRSSCWLRVSQPSAGAGWGHQFLPRIGQEVLVNFIEGDIDRPMITGVLYNGSHNPPEFSGAGSLPANKTLSGIKSKEFKGGQYNELLFDDTQNEVRTKLSCEHAKTQLNLGFLTHPRTEGKGEARGEGAELRTDAAAAIRAAHGILLSTDARIGASDTQLARQEMINHVQTALELLKSLGDSAETCHAFKTETEKQKAFNQQLAEWENGSNTAKDKANGLSPIIAISSPGGITSATPKTTTHYAGEQLNQIAGQHLQQTAGQQITLNAGAGISLFSQKEGMRLIAHEGQFLAQAQMDDIAINAQKGVAITSSTANIELNANKAITCIASGGAYIKLEGGNVEVGCPGAFTVKAGSHVWAGPGSLNGDVPKMPAATGLYNEAFQIKDEVTGNPMPFVKYRIEREDGQILEGIADAEGKTARIHAKKSEQIKLHIID
ncbi:MAG: type VI secretion system tip protein TssI/VgrG [Formivibrio sp.]|nr:type VI secretion system tip protein TssI/VgrG [Formivibrio sp.]